MVPSLLPKTYGLQAFVMNLVGALRGTGFLLLSSSRRFNSAIAFRMELVEESDLNSNASRKADENCRI
jgi:hypothetical protein